MTHRDPDPIEADCEADDTAAGRALSWARMAVRGCETFAGKVCVQYIPAVDELSVTFEDAADIDPYEPLEDVELIYDGTRAGRLLGLTVRGARLGRPQPWLKAVRALCGPTVWAAYEQLSGRPTLVGDDDEKDEYTLDMELPTEEWQQLRWSAWLAMHGSLWVDALNSAPMVELPEPDGVGLPLAAAMPRPDKPSNLLLPSRLAADCGLAPVGFVRLVDGGGVVIRFDIINPDEQPVADLKMELAGPYAAVGTPELDGDELRLRFEPSRPPPSYDTLVVVAHAEVRDIPETNDDDLVRHDAK